MGAIFCRGIYIRLKVQVTEAAFFIRESALQQRNDLLCVVSDRNTAIPGSGDSDQPISPRTTDFSVINANKANAPFST